MYRQTVRRALGDLIAMLRPLGNKARWARPEGMHVTIKFIGHAIADPGKLDSLRSALATVRLDLPVEMHFSGLGFFPDARRPRVFWCGVQASENLAQLVAGVTHALERFGVSRPVSQDEHAFVPHLTLARFKLPHEETAAASRECHDKLVGAADEMASRNFGFARESECHLYESLLKSTGAEYKKLETYSFVKESA
jgi:RNA 2',3'-cyclic 3'-phosphodiesterase